MKIPGLFHFNEKASQHSWATKMPLNLRRNKRRRANKLAKISRRQNR
jgi:hypothetical protein